MANDLEKRITAKMVLDSAGFNSSLQGVNGQLRLAQSELKNASASVSAFGKDSEKLKGVQDALAKQVELHAKKVDLYKESIEKTTTKMNDNIRERDKLKESLDNANKKYDEAIKLYGKESTESQKVKEDIAKLEKEYKNKEKAVESNAKQVNNYTTSLNKANAEMTKAQGELSKVSKELKEQDSKWINAGKTLKDHSEKLKNVGASASNLGDNLLKVSAPVVGLGAISLKFSTDFEDAMAQVSTISEDSEVSIGDLRKSILNLSNDTGIVAPKIANNVYDAISAGQKTGEAVNFVTNSTKLAKAGFAEAGASLDVLTTILNAYKLESKEVANVSDILIQVQNKGKVTVGELSSVMGKVIPTAVATNTNLKQLGAGYALMTSNGIKAAETTTYMNSMLDELSKTGTDTDKALREMSGKSFSDLMKEGKNLSDVLNILDGYAKKNKLSLKDMFGSAEAGKAALVLSTNAGKDFNSMLADMNNSAGSTDVAFNKVTNTTGERFRKSLNQLRNEAIRLGDTVAPLMDKGAELISKLTEKLGSMDEQQLKNIANIGLFTLGLGGVLKIGGGVVGSIGNIAGGLSKLSTVLGTAKIATEGVGAAAGVAGGATGLGGLGTALGGAAAAAVPWLIAGAAVVGVGYGIHKAMSQEVVPSIDLFVNKVTSTSMTMGEFGNKTSSSMQKTVVSISEGTKKAVGAYMELDSKAKQHIDSLYINSTTITEELKNATIAKFSEMNTKIVEGYRTQKESAILETTEMFTNTKTITDIEQKELLTSIDQYYKDQETTVNNANIQIKTILDRASTEHRQLTKEEYETVAMWKDKMKEKAVTALSENEIEAKVILERMKDYDGRITAEQAAEHISKLNESRDKAVSTANDEYEKRIALIERMKSEGVIKSQEQADKMIAEAKRQRDGIVENAEKTRMDAIEKMRKMNTDLETQVDTSSGKILTWWDKLKRWWTGWKPESKSFEYTITARQEQSGSIVPDEHWTGTNYYKGGLTTLHEKGYEVYDLPRSTRIYNHEASEDLVLKTAEKVASKVAKGMINRSNGANGVNVTQYIYSPVSSPAEMARQSKNSLRELGYF